MISERRPGLHKCQEPVAQDSAVIRFATPSRDCLQPDTRAGLKFQWNNASTKPCSSQTKIMELNQYPTHTHGLHVNLSILSAATKRAGLERPLQVKLCEGRVEVVGAPPCIKVYMCPLQTVSDIVAAKVIEPAAQHYLEPMTCV